MCSAHWSRTQRHQCEPGLPLPKFIGTFSNNFVDQLSSSPCFQVPLCVSNPNKPQNSVLNSVQAVTFHLVLRQNQISAYGHLNWIQKGPVSALHLCLILLCIIPFTLAKIPFSKLFCKSRQLTVVSKPTGGAQEQCTGPILTWQQESDSHMNITLLTGIAKIRFWPRGLISPGDVNSILSD